MNPAAKIDAGLRWSMAIVYVLFVGAMIWQLSPGLRTQARQLVRQMIWARQFALWADDFDRLPEWRKELLRTRGRAPHPERPLAATPEWAK